MDSINYVQVSMATSPNDHEKFIAAHEIKESESSRRNYARISSRVNWFPLRGTAQWMQTLAMLFGCNVKLVANEAKTHFERAVVDKRTFFFDHYVMEEDVSDFNAVREEVKRALLARGGLEQHCQLWERLKVVMGT